MDADYGRIRDGNGARLDKGEWENALFLLTQVMSHVHPARAICDAGLKSQSVDSGLPLVWGREGLEYKRISDEHGEICDPDGVLNPAVIVDSPPLTTDWRYHEHYADRDVVTEFAYETSFGFQRAVERCNGVGACRRLPGNGGTMCPSYMVTREERESTRGRANLFRRLIQQGPELLFSSTELKDAVSSGCGVDCDLEVHVYGYPAAVVATLDAAVGASLERLGEDYPAASTDVRTESVAIESGVQSVVDAALKLSEAPHAPHDVGLLTVPNASSELRGYVVLLYNEHKVVVIEVRSSQP